MTFYPLLTIQCQQHLPHSVGAYDRCMLALFDESWTKFDMYFYCCFRLA